MVWQGFLASCFHLPLRLPGRAALGLTVWAIYIADRLLDVRRPPAESEPARHRFYRTNGQAACWLLAGILAIDVFVTVLWLRPAVYRKGLVPLAAVLIYFGAVHTRVAIPRVLKASAVALLFTSGTFVVAWADLSRWSVTLLAPALAFFVLCLANLVAIALWESRELGRPFPFWVGALALACVVLGGQTWYWAIALSALAILFVFQRSTRLSIDARHVLVDAVLLSPLLFLVRG